MRNETEQIYFSYNQIVAIEEAIKEMQMDGISWESIKEIHNGGENHGSWITIEPTQSRYLIQLGMKAAKFLK